MRRSHRKVVLVVPAAALLAVAPSGAQTVQGILLNEKSHAPIGKAEVSLVDDSGHVAATASTDSATGTFYLDAPRPGDYLVRIRIGRGGLSFSPLIRMDSNQVVERVFAVPEWPRGILEAFLPDDVTTQATMDPQHRMAPRFPDRMRSTGRDGIVRSRFVIGPDGRVDMRTFTVVESTDDAFTKAVRDYLNDARYLPADQDGKPVPQVYDLTVDFGFGTSPSRFTGKNAIVVRALGVMRIRDRPNHELNH
jgi:hypothetical protein